jgi:hypothetical protein
MHVMDGFIGLPRALARDIEQHGLGIAHMALNIPEAIVSLKALVVDASCVRECARLCR